MEEKKFVCPNCEYAAKTERGLKIHMTRLHKDEKALVGPVVEEPVEPVVEEPLEVSSEEKKPTPSQLGITEIPVGARIRLNGVGSFWWRNPDTNAYEAKEAVSVPCSVVERLEQSGFMYLQVVSDCGQADWSCLEAAVLDGSVELVSLKDPAPVFDSSVDDFLKEEDPFLEDVESSIQNEVSLENVFEYKDACRRYAEVRDDKNKAAEKYKLVDSEVRPIILEFLEANGHESSEGAGDSVYKDEQFNVQYTFTPGAVSVKRDIPAIIEWCLANGHFYAIEAALNVEVWDNMVEKGMVPAEFITEVQTPVKGKDNRKLLVTDISK